MYDSAIEDWIMQFVFDEILIIVTFSQVQHTRTDDKFELKGVLGAFGSDTVEVHCYKALY